MTEKTKIKRTTLVDQIVNELHKQIITGKYKIGSTLPSEKDLLEQFSASRLPVRNAIMVLAKDGLIDVNQGRRCVVKDYRENARIEFFTDLWVHDPQKITREALRTLARYSNWLYGRTMISACRKAKPSDEEKLNKVLDAIEDDMSLFEWYVLDRNFIRELLRIAKDIALMMLHNSYAETMFKLLENDLIIDADIVDNYYRNSAPDIIKKICSNDMDGLRRCLRGVDSEIWKKGVRFYKKVYVEI